MKFSVAKAISIAAIIMLACFGVAYLLFVSRMLFTDEYITQEQMQALKDASLNSVEIHILTESINDDSLPYRLINHTSEMLEFGDRFDLFFLDGDKWRQVSLRNAAFRDIAWHLYPNSYVQRPGGFPNGFFRSMQSGEYVIIIDLHRSGISQRHQEPLRAVGSFVVQ